MKTPLQFITARDPECSSPVVPNPNGSERALLDEEFLLGYKVTHANKRQLIHGFQLNSELDAE